MTAAMLICCALIGGDVDTPYSTWVPDTPQEQTWPASIGAKLTASEIASLAQQSPTLPYHEIAAAIRLDDGTIWAAAKGGLLMRSPNAERWRVFHSRLWLPDDDVQNLAVAADGSVWAQTAQGIGRLRSEMQTLEQKMIQINDLVQRMHLREGLVGDVSLKEPGRIDAGHAQHTNDNDGLWTSMYVAAEAFRFAATGDPQARANAWKSLQALMFLEQITGIPGFVARSIIPITDDSYRHGGEWHRSADNRWWWKGDTSSDELDGHYFAYSIYYDVAATDEQREQIRPFVARITDHLLDHGYYYVGPSGKPTRWGVFAPEKLNQDLEWIADRGLNSLEILSHLKVAEHIVGNPRYKAAAQDLIKQHSYAINTVFQKINWPPSVVNHSDDELAFLAYYPLVVHEHDPELRKIYMASLERSWRIEQPEGSPLFNFIYAAGRQADTWTDAMKRPDQAYVPAEDYDQAVCLEWFRLVPQDTIIWTVKNSDRQDLGPLLENRFGQKRSETVLPVDERALMKWNGDPFELDRGADGRARDDGAYILLPYWMGRYHRFID